jgi:hypothetical protein
MSRRSGARGGPFPPFLDQNNPLGSSTGLVTTLSSVTSPQEKAPPTIALRHDVELPGALLRRANRCQGKPAGELAVTNCLSGCARRQGGVSRSKNPHLHFVFGIPLHTLAPGRGKSTRLLIQRYMEHR